MMHAIPVLFSLAAAASASKALHYTVPSNFKALTSNCTLPAAFVVTNFTTYTDKKDDSLNTICFEFNDPGTQVRTACQRNSTSISSGPSKNIYGCDDASIAFIYQTTGIAGLTLTEKVCPSAGTPKFEVSGLISPELDCTDTSTGTLCHAKQESLQGDFDSFEPIPPKAPTRRSRSAWRG